LLIQDNAPLSRKAFYELAQAKVTGRVGGQKTRGDVLHVLHLAIIVEGVLGGVLGS
jgi:hypothetical protein